MGERKPCEGHASISEAIRAYRRENPKALQRDIAAALGTGRSNVQNALAAGAGRKRHERALAAEAGCLTAIEAGTCVHRDTKPAPTRELVLHLAAPDYAALVEAAIQARRTPAQHGRALLLAAMGRARA